VRGDGFHAAPTAPVTFTMTWGARRTTVASMRSRMSDAARVAFGAELGATLQRIQALHERPGRRLEQWLTHAAAAATASAVTLTVTVLVWGR
jgi:hypothetical protein